MGLAASLVQTYLDGQDDDLPTGVYQWHGRTPPDNDLRGGHHVNFGVSEYDGEGQLLVASQTLTTQNAWRLTFGDGLRSVEEIEPSDVDEEAAQNLTPMVPQHIRNKLVDAAQAQGRDPHAYLMDPDTPGPRYW